MSVGSLERRCADDLRGVEVRVVQSAARATMSAWRLRFNRGQILQVTLLFAMLVLATAAIAYVSWPIVFALVVIAGAIWCWQLEEGAQASDPVGSAKVLHDRTAPMVRDEDRQESSRPRAAR
jgi:hypothetical protein